MTDAEATDKGSTPVRTLDAVHSQALRLAGERQADLEAGQ
jgi:hypothetical protein